MDSLSATADAGSLARLRVIKDTRRSPSSSRNPQLSKTAPIFGASTSRFVVSKNEVPGPGSYSAKPVESNRRHGVVKSLSFGATTKRFKSSGMALPHMAKVPGPGAYEPEEQPAETSDRSYSVFTSRRPRFYSPPAPEYPPVGLYNPPAAGAAALKIDSPIKDGSQQIAGAYATARPSSVFLSKADRHQFYYARGLTQFPQLGPGAYNATDRSVHADPLYVSQPFKSTTPRFSRAQTYY